MGYVPLFYEVISLLFFFFHGLSMVFIKPQNLLLMDLAFFFICKLKGLDTTCKIFNFHRMRLITKLLLNMRKQYIKTVPSEIFCLWLLAWKQQLLHPFLISVNIVFLQILWPINWCTCSMYTTHLILLSNISWVAVGFYDVCSF